MEPLIGISELSEMLTIKPGTIRNWIAARKIPYIKLGGAVKFSTTQISLWLKEKQVEAVNH